MDKFSELIAAVRSDLNASSNSSLFPEATIKLAINRAYRVAGGLFRWPETEDAKKTSTGANAEYYDYPSNWKPDSIWRVEVDGVPYGDEPDYDPITFKDYLNWKYNNPDSTDKKWGNQWRRFFIYPVPTTDGTNNIHVWGQKVVDALVNNTDTTIFSYAYPECNEAVVREAVAILQKKGEKTESGQMRSAEAEKILSIAFQKIRQEGAKYEKVYPFWQVRDMFGRGNSSTTIGNFDLNN